MISKLLRTGSLILLPALFIWSGCGSSEQPETKPATQMAAPATGTSSSGATKASSSEKPSSAAPKSQPASK